jgi:NAD-dependent deacetylase
MGQILVFSGAGLSADSGLATFRDSNGTWANHDVNKVANISTLDDNRELVFKFYNERRVELGKAGPNKAHVALAKLQAELGSERVKLVTQNVDDLLERAGCTDVLHVHGRLNELQCMMCGHCWDIGYAEVQLDVACPCCGPHGYVKPNVVFFGEQAPQYNAMHTIFDHRQPDDVIIVIGTSGNVVPMSYIIGHEQTTYNLLCNKVVRADTSFNINYLHFNLIFEDSIINCIDEMLDIAKQRVLANIPFGAEL